MAKLTLNRINSFVSGMLSTLNVNWGRIEQALENTLSRDGSTPNAMNANIDMNNHRIVNVAEPSSDNDVVRKIDLEQAVASFAGDGGNVLFDSDIAVTYENNSAKVAAASSVFELNGRVNSILSNNGVPAIKNNLLETVPGSTLDAVQGTVLKGLIDDLEDDLGTLDTEVNARIDSTNSSISGIESDITAIETQIALIQSTVGSISPFSYGAVGNGVADDTVALNAAATACVAQNKFLDLRGAGAWRITGRVVLTKVPGVIAGYASEISADVSGTYTGGYAVQIGDPTKSAFDPTGRADGFTLLGHLRVQASSRSTALGGVYLKGSFINVDHIRAVLFNGCGMFCDAVWDSTIQRISVELCGNISTYAVRFDSATDTYNATNVVSLQCEQAYQRGVFINAIRCNFNNIHAERMSIISISDGQSIAGIATYISHYILLSNSVISQAVFDCLTSGTAPDGTALAATQCQIIMNGDNAHIDACQAGGSKVWSTYGNRLKISTLSCADFTQRSPSAFLTMVNCNIGNLYLEGSATVISTSITTFNPFFNGRDINVYGGTVGTIDCTSTMQGDISFFGTKITTVSRTRSAVAGRRPLTLNDCNIGTLNGAYQEILIVNGGYITTAALVDRAVVVFNDVFISTFGYTGTPAHVTRNCRASTVSSWAVPGYNVYTAGTVTERLGYSAAGKFYQNTDGSGGTWVPVGGTGLVSTIGTVGTVSSGTLTATAEAFGNFVTLTFTLTAARITITDGAGSGSYGSIKLFDFAQAGLTFLGCRQNYTAFVEGSALTTSAGDAVHVLGVGTSAISTARDGTLTGNEQNVGTVTSQITNSGGTGTGTIFTGPVSTAIDGTSTAADLYLNWSGTAATIDGSSTIDVTGTITVVCAFLGDD